MKHTQDINSIYLCLKTILTDYMDMEIADSENEAELRQIAISIHEVVRSNDS